MPRCSIGSRRRTASWPTSPFRTWRTRRWSRSTRRSGSMATAPRRGCPPSSRRWTRSPSRRCLDSSRNRSCSTPSTPGGFGRRTPLDSHVQREAAAIAKRMRGTPVKVVWTREDDVQGGYYRPMFVHHVEVGVGARGMPAAWRHVVVGQSHIIGTGPPWEGGLVKNGVDELVVEGTADSRYAIPNFHVSAHQPTINVPVAQWRSVGMTHNAFVMETLIDELAVRAKVDPIAYRLALLRPDARKLRNPLALL